MKQKITVLLQQLNHGLVEREAHLKLTLLTVLTGENIVLVGPPGTGKSMIARRVAKCLEQPDNNPVHFEYLLTKFSTPEEIFGPLSISELKADRFRRNTTGYLPSVKVAFLDEIFKASSSILNALLTILNERIYHNGAIAEKVPLQALIAASNELPTGQEELAALYDRFLIRSFVDYVSPENLSRLFEPSSAAPESNTLGSADLAEIAQRAESVALPAEIIDAIQQIWQQHKETFKEDRRESLSDRRLKKLINLLRVSAATNDRQEVDLSDVLLLKDCLWNHPDNAEMVRNLILNILQKHSRPVPLIPNETAEEMIYEVAEDGHTLIPANARPNFLPSPTARTPASAAGKRPGNVIKGFRGSGTQDDPLLIETKEELADLSRPEIGQQGYYFKQIADINLSEITTWPNIFFCGHYDGNEKTIKSKDEYLFKKSNNSNIKNLTLEKTKLSMEINECQIYYCTSNDLLIEKANESIITGCKTTNQITKDAIGCKISMCQTNFPLIRNTASNCQIENCIVSGNLSSYETPNNVIGGFATSLEKNSALKFCFFCTSKTNTKNTNLSTQTNTTIGNIINAAAIGANTTIGNTVTALTIAARTNDKNIFGHLTSDFYTLSGFSVTCKNSSIEYCAIGNSQGINFKNRITEKRARSNIKNNISIDSNPGNSNPDGEDGESISAALYTQRYFEFTLGWDFENIWYWDSTVDEPRLRTVGAGNATPQEDFPTGDTITADLLTQQVKANLWL